MGKKWLGPIPTRCDLDNAELKGTFVDGKTRGGPWANMCEQCFSKHGVGLGTGRGQRYDATTGEKIDG